MIYIVLFSLAVGMLIGGFITIKLLPSALKKLVDEGYITFNKKEKIRGKQNE